MFTSNADNLFHPHKEPLNNPLYHVFILNNNASVSQKVDYGQ